MRAGRRAAHRALWPEHAGAGADQYGSEAQKRHWLPRILDGTDWWCQGYSEPGAGSDLAAVQTTAVRDGDDYIVNGQKTWTTLGHYANMIFCLVRTSHEGRRQEGISFLLIDMRSPGVEVRPIITLDGEHEVNEVFFSDVRVPAANLVGEENRGWTCAKYLLTYERTNIAGVGQSTAALARLKAMAARQRRNGRPLADDPDFAARLARVEIELANMRTTNLRVVAAVERRRAGRGKLDAEDTRHPDPPGNHRAEPPRHGSLCRVGDGGTRHGADTPIGRTAPTPPRRNTSTTASCRSSAAPMKSRKHHRQDDPGTVRAGHEL